MVSFGQKETFKSLQLRFETGFFSIEPSALRNIMAT